MALKLGDLQLNLRAKTEGFDKANAELRKQAQVTKKAERGLVALKSSLGGADRAAVQLKKGEDRLRASLKAGIISTKEHARLTKLLGQRFTTTAVKARSLSTSMKKIGSALSVAKGAFVAFIGVMAVAKIGGFINKTIEAADAIAKTADVLGVSTTLLQEYRIAAQLAGIEQTKLDESLKQFVGRLGELRVGTGSLNTFLDKLDKQFKQNVISANSTSDAIKLIFDRVNQLPDAAGKVALLRAAFGRAGAGLVNMADSIDESIKKVRELGLVIDEKLLRSAEATNDKLTLLAKVISVKFSVAILKNADAIGQLADQLARAIPQMIEMARQALLFFGLIDKSNQQKLVDLNDQISDLTTKLNRLGSATVGHRGRLIQELEAKRQELMAARAALIETMRQVPTTGTATAGPPPISAPTVVGTAPGAVAPLASVEATERFAAANKAAMTSLDRFRQSQINFGETVRQELLTPIDVFHQRVAALDQALKLHTITQTEHSAAVALAGRTYDATINPVEQLSASMQRTANNVQRVKEVTTNFAQAIGTAFEDAVIRADSFRDVLVGLVQDIQRIFLRAAVTKPLEGFILKGLGALFSGGGGLGPQFTGTGAAGLASSASFASGGAFTVGGSGGTDTTPVAFNATRGERVTVETPAQQRAGEGAVIQNININVQAGVSQTVRAEMMSLLPQFREEAKAAVIEARLKDPGIFGGRGL